MSTETKLQAYQRGRRLTRKEIFLNKTYTFTSVMRFIADETPPGLPEVLESDVRVEGMREASRNIVRYSYQRMETMKEWETRAGWVEPVWEPESWSFSVALNHLKMGGRVARTGWNGKGMWVQKVVEQNPHQSYLQFKAADDTRVPWVASQTDLLAEDWVRER